MIKFLLLLSSSLFASDLIYNHSEIEILDKRLSERNFNLGSPITPYLVNNNRIIKVFKNFSNVCTEVIFYSNFIKTKRSNCSKNYDIKLANYPNFKLVPKNFKFTEEMRLLKEEVISASYLGAPYKFHLRDLYDASNLKDFKFSLLATSTLIKKDSEFKLVQNIRFQREIFHYMPLKEENHTQTISYKDRDLLFKDDYGRFILYKKYQPKPFSFTYMWLNDSYIDYLNTVQSLLFKENNQSYCFMDTSYSPSLYDCEHIALKNKPFLGYNIKNLFFID